MSMKLATKKDDRDVLTHRISELEGPLQQIASDDSEVQGLKSAVRVAKAALAASQAKQKDSES
jgi:hypothetical protein